MLERFMQKTEFSNYEDFMNNFKVTVPADINFGYDVIDRYAIEMPEKEAILWVNDHGEQKHVTYRAFKNVSDQCAAFLQGIGFSCLNQLFYHILQLFSQKDGNNGRWCLITSESVIISNIGRTLSQKVRVGIHRLHNAG